MGLFDGGGGDGLDINALMQMLNPMGSAQAAGGALTPEQLLQSQSATNPIVPPPGGLPEPPGSPSMPRSVGAVPITPTGPPPIPPGGVTKEEMAGVPVSPGPPVRMPANPGRPDMNPEVVPPGGLGAVLNGTPIPGAEGPTSVGGGPLAPAPEGTSSATDIGSRARTPAARGTLAEALKGVAAPKPPEVQKISSPNAPRPTGTIKGGDLQALLMALNAGAPSLDRKLPMTLGRG